MSNSKNAPVNSTIVSTRRRLLWADNNTTMDGRRRLMATADAEGASYTGIGNPTVCLRYGETMMFTVDNDNYPVYDR